jgi:hypothetical protein
MKKELFLIIAIAFAVFIVACKKNNDVNYSFTINITSSNGGLASSRFKPTKYFAHDTTNYYSSPRLVEIVAYDTTFPTSLCVRQLSLVIQDYRGLGTYELSFDSLNPVTANFVVYTYMLGGYYSDFAGKGSINISELNSTRVKGSFNLSNVFGDSSYTASGSFIVPIKPLQ